MEVWAEAPEKGSNTVVRLRPLQFLNIINLLLK